MFHNYLVITLRNLARHKVSTFINVVGLSVGIAVCIAIMLFIRHETTFDAFHENGEDIYGVITDQLGPDGTLDRSVWQPMPMIPALRQEFPEVVQATRISGGGAIISRGQNVFEETVLFVDPDFFRMFSFNFVEGGGASVLENPGEIVITPEMATKYFGDEPAIGKTLHMRTRAGEDDFIVAGIAESPPPNSSIVFNFVANLRRHSMYERAKERWTSSNGVAFIRLAKETSGPDFESKLPAFVTKYYSDLIRRWRDAGELSKEDGAWSMSLRPMTEGHLDMSVQGASQGPRGNPVYSYILAGIGLLVLSVACINFVMLTVGRSAYRAKEVGIRKVLGAVRSQLVRQFWGEALLLCMVSLVIGMLFAELFLPTFSSISGTKLTLRIGSDGVIVGGMTILLLVVGLAAGSYPALYLSRFDPVETLKGKFKLHSRGFFTRALIVFQFGLSIFLVCSAILLRDQVSYLVTKNLGFRPEQVVVIPTYGGDALNAERVSRLYHDRIRENPDILQSSVVSGAFTHAYDIEGFQVNGERKRTHTLRVDERYLGTLGIALKHGRNLDPLRTSDVQRGIIVNEAFLRMMNWPEPAVGKRIEHSDSKLMENLEVVGVVSDFHFTSLREEIQPIMMFLNPDWPLDHMLVRISKRDVPATLQYLLSVWREISPEAPFNATFLDEDFQAQYEGEMKWGRIVTTASALAISLTCLGLFGMISVTVAARTKEIGIRKVLGASGTVIVRLVSKEYLGLVLLGNVIAWPAAYFAASTFLENYAYRIEISVSMFLVAGLAALAVAFIAIGGHVVKAARANPVESLRYE